MATVTRLLSIPAGDTERDIFSRTPEPGEDADLVTVDDPSEALDRLESTTVDGVVAGYTPGESGAIAVLPAIRARYPDLPLVLYTRAMDDWVRAAWFSAEVTEAVLVREDEQVSLHRLREVVDRGHPGSETPFVPGEGLFGAPQDICFALGADGTLQRWGDGLADLTGHDDPNLDSMQVADLVTDRGGERFSEAIDGLEAGSQARFQAAMLTADGSSIPHEFSAISFRAPGDGPALVCFGRDVSGEAELAETLDMYEMAFDTARDGIGVVDEERTFHMINQSFAENLGVTKADILDQRLENSPISAALESDMDEYIDLYVEAWEEAVETGRSEFSYEAVANLERGESVLDIRVSATRREDAGDVLFTLVIRDITERKRREAQIEKLHHWTRKLMHAESAEEVARLTSRAVEQALDHPANVIRLLDESGEYLEPMVVTDEARTVVGDPEPVTVEGNPMGESFSDGEPMVIDDIQAETDVFADYPVRTVLVLPMAEYGTIGIVAREMGAFDSSDREIAELLASNAGSAFERVERERELARRNERLDEFASMVSHDLRNPLNVAQGFLDIARESPEAEHFDRIASSLDRMDQMVDDLLSLARHGDAVESMESVALAPLVDRCWAQVETGDAEVIVPATSTVRADRSRLRQLLENMLRNAIEHGGTDVTVTVGDLDGEGFFIEDDGPGIPAADRESVFESGFSTGSDGNGLGLAIVREIVQAHGWQVRVVEGRNGGARFEFTGVGMVE